MVCHSVMLSTTIALAGLFSGTASDVTCKPTDSQSCMCDGEAIGPHTWSPPPYMVSSAKSFWDLTAEMEDKVVPLAHYKTKAALVVNVASAWGLQFQNYPGFRRLLNKYAAHGFQLIAFPSNQFGEQATGSSACERAYMYHKLNATAGEFPVFDKVVVNGPGTSPVYTFLKGKMFKGDDVFGEIAWNYEKFLVNESGIPVHRVASQTDPEKSLENAIRELVGLAVVTAV